MESLDSQNLKINEDVLNKILTHKNDFFLFYQKRELLSSNSQFDVSSSTYRAFRNMRQKPSLVFKEWAFNILSRKDFLDKLAMLQTKEDFFLLHAETLKDIDNAWINEQGLPLSIPHKNKLIDLFFKSLCRCEFRNEKINYNLLTYANLPLDSITFPIIDDLFLGKLKLKNKTMGYINTQAEYNYMQNIVYMATRKMNMPSLCLDFYAKLKIRN